MRKFRFLFEVFFMVTTCVLTAVAVFTTILSPEDSLKPEVLWQILAVSGLCTLGCLIYPWERNPGKREMGIRILIHYLLINAIVLAAGFRFGWYRTDHVRSVLSMVICIAVIFVLVSAVTWTKAAREAKEMNERLKKYRNKENT